MAGRWQFLLVHVWPWHLAPAWGTDVLAAEVVVPVSLLGANTGMLHAGMQLMLMLQPLCSWPSPTLWSSMLPSACRGVPALARSQCSPAGSRRMLVRAPTPCAGNAPAPHSLIQGFPYARCNCKVQLLVMVLDSGMHCSCSPNRSGSHYAEVSMAS